MDVAPHKEAVIKVRLKPWVDEVYALIGNIKDKLATLQ